eukprot:131660-Amphidinium_carterae.1
MGVSTRWCCKDAFCVARNIIMHPFLVPGGGAIEMEIAARLKDQVPSIGNPLPSPNVATYTKMPNPNNLFSFGGIFRRGEVVLGGQWAVSKASVQFVFPTDPTSLTILST